jgi:hypothetical protein
MADTANRIAGTASLTVDGATYQLAGKFAYSVASVSRETKGGQDRIHGYKEMPKAPHISASLRDADGLSLADINAMTNVTVTAILANGKTVTGRNMWTVEDQDVDTEEGTFEVRWEGFDGAVEES